MNRRLGMTFLVLALAIGFTFSTTMAIAADFPAPTGDPRILPRGAKLELIWDGGCVLTEGVAAGHEG